MIESENMIFEGLMRDFSILIVVPAGLRFVGKYESLEESALYGISCSFREFEAFGISSSRKLPIMMR